MTGLSYVLVAIAILAGGMIAVGLWLLWSFHRPGNIQHDAIAGHSVSTVKLPDGGYETAWFKVDGSMEMVGSERRKDALRHHADLVAKVRRSLP